MSDKIFHIGLHKTGTTFLQSELFSKLDEVQLVRGWHSIRSIFTAPSKKKIIISDERLSGNPFGGSWINDFESNVLLLKSLFGDPMIIIGFRRHDSMVLSLYKQYLLWGGTAAINQFYSPKSSDTIIRTTDLWYESRIKELEKYFSRIYVYIQEDIRESWRTVFYSLLQFMEYPTDDIVFNDVKSKNIGITGQYQMSLLLRLNKIDSIMKRLPSSPSLYNRLFKKLHLTPRYICRHGLRWFRSNPIILESYLNNYLLDHFKDDWNYVLSRKNSTV